MDELMSKFLVHGSLHGNLQEAIGHLRLYQQLGGLVELTHLAWVATITYGHPCTDDFADALINTLRTLGEETQVLGIATFGREHLKPSILHIRQRVNVGTKQSLPGWLSKNFRLDRDG
jgi:hypothetical protein